MNSVKTVDEGWEAYKHSFKSDRQTLKAAFEAGVKWAVQETLDTLGDYGTACAGLGSEQITPEEIYDRVAANLRVYYAQIGVKI